MIKIHDFTCPFESQTSRSLPRTSKKLANINIIIFSVLIKSFDWDWSD